MSASNNHGGTDCGPRATGGCFTPEVRAVGPVCLPVSRSMDAGNVSQEKARVTFVIPVVEQILGGCVGAAVLPGWIRRGLLRRDPAW